MSSDLLYSDGGIPFGEVGRTLIANLYNTSIASHGGKQEAVYNHKEIGSGEFIREAGVQDVLSSMGDVMLLSSGPSAEKPSRLLGDGFARGLAELRTRFDHVIVDAPPLPQFADDPRPFTRDELDKIAPDNPVALQESYYQVFLNSRALKAFGIEANVPDPKDFLAGTILRDAAGKPTGVIKGDIAATRPLPHGFRRSRPSNSRRRAWSWSRT